MSGKATAAVTFSMRSAYEELHGPAGSRIWRPGYLACLIEKHLPVWVITPIGFAAGEEPSRLLVTSDGQGDRPAVADLVVVMAGLFGGNDRLRQMALAEGLLHQRGSSWWVTPNVNLPSIDEWDDEEPEANVVHASQELFFEASRVCAYLCRVTVMAYPQSIVSAQGSVAWLRGAGFDVDEFGLVAVGDGQG